jgi:hypothetical protein
VQNATISEPVESLFEAVVLKYDKCSRHAYEGRGKGAQFVLTAEPSCAYATIDGLIIINKQKV